MGEPTRVEREVPEARASGREVSGSERERRAASDRRARAANGEGLEELGVCALDEATQTPDPQAGPEPGVLERREVARGRLKGLERLVTQRVYAHAAWLSAEWTQFIGKTGGNPSVVFSEGELLQAVTGGAPMTVGAALLGEAKSKAIGAGAGVVKGGLEAAVKAEFIGIAGSVVAFAGAGLVGILAGMVWPVINAILSDREQGKKLHQTLRAQAQAIVERADLFDGQAASLIADQQVVFDNADHAAAHATTHAALTLLESWAEAQMSAIPGPGPRGALAERLLASWVLQHSVGPDEADDTTNESSFEGATDGKDGTRVKAEVDGQKPILFVHQLKRGLLEAGLVDRGALAHLERSARALASGGPSGLTRAFDGASITLAGVSDPKAFARALDRATSGPLGVESGRVPNYLGPARKGNVRARVRLRVCEDEGCAVLDALELSAECVGRDREAYEEGKSFHDSDGGFGEIDWRWTP